MTPMILMHLSMMSGDLEVWFFVFKKKLNVMFVSMDCGSKNVHMCVWYAL